MAHSRTEETTHKVKFSYARDFLLSLADSEECKTLPSDLDPSILREIKDASSGWAQYTDNSDFGSHYKISQHGRPKPIHIGILGSGASSGVSHGVAESTTPSSQNVDCLLTRSAAPYRPPHLNKRSLSGSSPPSGPLSTSSPSTHLFAENTNKTTATFNAHDVKDDHIQGSACFSEPSEKLFEDPLPVDEYEATESKERFKVACEGTVHSTYEERPGVNRVGKRQCIHDDPFVKIGPHVRNKPNLILCSSSGFGAKADLLDEICLPEEYNLITIDDFCVQQEEDYKSTFKSSQSEAFKSHLPVDIAEKLMTSEDSYIKNDILSHLGADSTDLFDSPFDIRTSLEMEHNLWRQPFYLWWRETQMHPERASYHFNSLAPESSNFEPLEKDLQFKISHLLDSSSPHVLPCSLRQRNKLDYHFSPPHNLQVSIPNRGPLHPLNTLPRDELPQRLTKRAAASGMENNPQTNFPWSYWQHGCIGTCRFGNCVSAGRN